MALTRQQKKEIINDLREKIARQKTMVFVNFEGFKTEDLSELRKRLKESESQLQVFKKTLFKVALQKEGIELNINELQGQVAVVFGFKDKILPAKTVYNFFRRIGVPEILGGFFDNEFKESEEIINLAELPTREELLAQLTGTLSSSILNFTNILQGNIRNLVFVLGAIKK